MTIHQRIQKEIKQAEEKYGSFNSTHEAYGVLKEEVEEFWELVKNKKQRIKVSGECRKVYFFSKSDLMISELIQIAAVAIRTAKELEENKIKHV